MKLTAVGYRILIKLKTVEEEYKTDKIVIPDSLRDRHQASMEIGEVVEVGPQAYKDVSDGTCWCAPGDKILFTRNSGRNYYDEDTKTMYQIINDQDVQAIIEE